VRGARASVPPISEEYDVSKSLSVTPRRTRVVAASSETESENYGGVHTDRARPHCPQRRTSCLLLLFFFYPVQHPGPFLYSFPIFFFLFSNERKRSSFFFLFVKFDNASIILSGFRRYRLRRTIRYTRVSPFVYTAVYIMAVFNIITRHALPPYCIVAGIVTVVSTSFVMNRHYKSNESSEILIRFRRAVKNTNLSCRRGARTTGLFIRTLHRRHSNRNKRNA